jgi:hypothetical protein
MLLCPTQFFRLNEVQPKLKTIPLVSNESILFQVRQITYWYVIASATKRNVGVSESSHKVRCQGQTNVSLQYKQAMRSVSEG